MPTPPPTETQPDVVIELSVAHTSISDESQRLDELLAVVENVSSILDLHNGERLQVRCDGLTAGFAVDSAHDAINAAIDVQQAHQSDRPSAAWLATGIATGPVTRLDGDFGPIGATVERARQLAVAANAGAVLADLDTIVSAQLHQIRSMRGQAEGRRPLDYLSPQGWLPTRAPTRPVQYHEVIWDTYPHGLRPDLLNVPTQPAPATGGRSTETAWMRGRLRNWNRDRQHGFIATDDGEFFYVDDRFLASDAPPAVGSEVLFSPRPALIPGKNRVAALVTSADELTREKHATAVELHDRAGNSATLSPIPSRAISDLPVDTG